MLERNYFLFSLAAIRSDKKFHVDSVRVADGDTRLQPAKLHLPHASKRIWTGCKKPALVDHDPMLSRIITMLYMSGFVILIGKTEPGSRSNDWRLLANIMGRDRPFAKLYG